MENLPNELLLIISLKLDLNSMINFSSVNKNNFKLLDDNFLKNYMNYIIIQIYGKLYVKDHCIIQKH